MNKQYKDLPSNPDHTSIKPGSFVMVGEHQYQVIEVDPDPWATDYPFRVTDPQPQHSFGWGDWLNANKHDWLPVKQGAL